ncbi:MAG: zeta toxin family protein, partial [Bryobacteraceae bacterium]
NLLAAHDFPEFLLHELLAAVRAQLAGDSTAGAEAVREAAAGHICRRLSFRPEPAGQCRPAVIVLAGPPGAGKTSTLVKIAMREAIAKRRSAAIVSTDGFRVAASEQLRTYAAILGLPYALAETPAALRQAAAENASRDLILVDTPGFSRSEQDWALEWARMLDEIPGRETLLVLPASLRTVDLLDGLRWWSMLSPTALVFSRMDETSRIGGWVSAAIESSLPVSFFSTGQRIPEDLEAASEARILVALGCKPAAASGGLAAGAGR